MSGQTEYSSAPPQKPSPNVTRWELSNLGARSQWNPRVLKRRAGSFQGSGSRLKHPEHARGAVLSQDTWLKVLLLWPPLRLVFVFLK